MINRLFEEQRVIRRRDIPYKDTKDSPRVCKDNPGIYFQVCLATVTHQDELAFRKIFQDTFQRRSFSFRCRFKNPLEHPAILLHME